MQIQSYYSSSPLITLYEHSKDDLTKVRKSVRWSYDQSWLVRKVSIFVLHSLSLFLRFFRSSLGKRIARVLDEEGRVNKERAVWAEFSYDKAELNSFVENSELYLQQKERECGTFLAQLPNDTVPFGMQSGPRRNHQIVHVMHNDCANFFHKIRGSMPQDEKSRLKWCKDIFPIIEAFVKHRSSLFSLDNHIHAIQKSISNYHFSSCWLVTALFVVASIPRINYLLERPLVMWENEPTENYSRRVRFQELLRSMVYRLRSRSNNSDITKKEMKELRLLIGEGESNQGDPQELFTKMVEYLGGGVLESRNALISNLLCLEADLSSRNNRQDIAIEELREMKVVYIYLPGHYTAYIRMSNDSWRNTDNWFHSTMITTKELAESLQKTVAMSADNQYYGYK